MMIWCWWWWWWWRRHDLILIRIPRWICWLGLNIALLLGLVAGVEGRVCRRSKTYCVPNCRRCVDSHGGWLTNLALVSMAWYMRSAQIIQVSDKCHWIVRIINYGPKTQRDNNYVAQKRIPPIAGHWHLLFFIHQIIILLLARLFMVQTDGPPTEYSHCPPAVKAAGLLTARGRKVASRGPGASGGLGNWWFMLMIIVTWWWYHDLYHHVLWATIRPSVALGPALVFRSDRTTPATQV